MHALLLVSMLAAAAQSPGIDAARNLLTNGDAASGLSAWQATGDATVEECDGARCFVIRNGGSLSQPAEVPDPPAGGFVVFLARGSASRVDPGAGITDRPYLYGLMIAADGRRITGYNQGDTMRGRDTKANAWTTLWGIFAVPAGTARIVFQMKQGLRSDVPHDGSAARFANVGLFLFPTRADADAFVARYR